MEGIHLSRKSFDKLKDVMETLQALTLSTNPDPQHYRQVAETVVHTLQGVVPGLVSRRVWDAEGEENG